MGSIVFTPRGVDTCRRVRDGLATKEPRFLIIETPLPFITEIFGLSPPMVWIPNLPIGIFNRGYICEGILIRYIVGGRYFCNNSLGDLYILMGCGFSQSGVQYVYVHIQPNTIVFESRLGVVFDATDRLRQRIIRKAITEFPGIVPRVDTCLLYTSPSPRD